MGSCDGWCTKHHPKTRHQGDAKTMTTAGTVAATVGKGPTPTDEEEEGRAGRQPRDRRTNTRRPPHEEEEGGVTNGRQTRAARRFRCAGCNAATEGTKHCHTPPRSAGVNRPRARISRSKLRCVTSRGRRSTETGDDGVEVTSEGGRGCDALECGKSGAVENGQNGAGRCHDGRENTSDFHTIKSV